MNKFLLVIICLLIAGGVNAQKSNLPVNAAAKNVLKNSLDSSSYAAGMNISDGLIKQGITRLNTPMFQKGMETIFSKKRPLVNDIQGNIAAQRFFSLLKANKLMDPQPAAAASPALLKSTFDSASYFFGLNVGKNLQKQNFSRFNTGLLCKALDAAIKKKTTLLAAPVATLCLQQYIQAQAPKTQTTTTIKGPDQAQVNEKLKAEKDKGAVFLASNKQKAGVITTASGLQYEILKKGDSTSAKPTLTDKFVVNYVGTLIDGTEFDNSYKRGQPLSYGVTQVIPGWTEALQLMHIGDKFKIYLPSTIGYGDFGSGPNIPGGATLIFEMELLQILK